MAKQKTDNGFSITVTADGGAFVFTKKEFNKQVANVKKGIDFDLSKARSMSFEVRRLDDINDTYWPRG
jgi:hypothetical protein|tara:strand:- start:13058 stop:13261 length:204 start_codon:yes stop_codon:yes gene_type:complete